MSGARIDMRSVEAMEPKEEILSLNMEKPVATGTPPVNRPDGMLMMDSKVLTPLHPTPTEYAQNLTATVVAEKNKPYTPEEQQTIQAQKANPEDARPMTGPIGKLLELIEKYKKPLAVGGGVAAAATGIAACSPAEVQTIPPASPTEQATIPTQTPDNTPLATQTPGPEVTTPPEQLSKLDQNLKSWEAGTFPIPTSELSKNPDGTLRPINIEVPPKGIPTDLENKAYPTYQGVILGGENVKIGNHEDLIVYVGQKSKIVNQKNPFYYMALNLGDLKDPRFQFSVISGLSDITGSSIGGDGRAYDSSQVFAELDNLTGHASGFLLYSYPVETFQFPDSPDWVNTINSQTDFTANTVYEFSADAGWAMNYKDSPYYPKVEKLINTRITENSNEANIPIPMAFQTH
jgi:hypothetical protein